MALYRVLREIRREGYVKKRIPGSFFMVWYRRAVAAIPLHDAIEEYVAIRKRKRVTDKKVTEIVDELLKAGRF